MDRSNDGLGAARQFLKQLKATHQFNAPAFDVPEVSSLEEILAFFDAMGEEQRIQAARQYGISVEEYREQMAIGWKEIVNDPSYISLNSFEISFLIMIEPIVADIISAAEGIAGKLPITVNRNVVFGLLPIDQIRATAVKVPGHESYVIGISHGLMFYLYNMGVLVNECYENLSKKLATENLDSDVIHDTLPTLVETTIGTRTNELFCDLVVSYFHTGLAIGHGSGRKTISKLLALHVLTWQVLLACPAWKYLNIKVTNIPVNKSRCCLLTHQPACDARCWRPISWIPCITRSTQTGRYVW